MTAEGPPPTKKPSRARRIRGHAGDILWPVVAVGLFIVAWDLYIRIADVKRYALAPPGEAFKKAVTDAGVLSSNAVTTLEEMLLGFVIAAGVGLLIALVLDRSEKLERLFYPFLLGSQVVPLVAIAPVIVLVLGFGILPKITIVAIFATFVIVLESLVGLRGLEVEKEYLARSMGANSTDFFLKLKIPQALPNIFSGLKLAVTLSVIGAVVAEFIAADKGLGHYVLTANANQDTVDMLAGIIWLAGIGIIAFVVMDVIERLAIPWHASHRTTAVEGRST